MEGRFIHKVPGGKLLKVAVDYDSGRIVSVRINGDFFAHPEDGVERLEAALSGKRIDEIESVVRDFSGVVFYGISLKDIVFAIREAVK